MDIGTVHVDLLELVNAVLVVAGFVMAHRSHQRRRKRLRVEANDASTFDDFPTNPPHEPGGTL